MRAHGPNGMQASKIVIAAGEADPEPMSRSVSACGHNS
jgi:hypothetical protein